MDLELTDEQQELRTSVRAFLARECPIGLVRAVVEQGERVDALWQHMVELGWPGLTVAAEHGGVGLGFVELGVVVEELGRVIAPGPFLATASQFVPVVRHAGTPEQRARFLGAVASGGITGALAASGATGSAAAADLGVVAHRADGGWRLEGAEHHVLDGDTADGSRSRPGSTTASVCSSSRRARRERAPHPRSTPPVATPSSSWRA